jgi:peptidoglycan/xylan/chitin deacetylase (PgdA/CDA1 family)
MKPPTLRDYVKLGLAAAVEGSGLGAACRAARTFAAGARIHVVGYHRVVDEIDFRGPVNPSLCITTDAFRAQMEQLRRHFLVLPLSYVVRALAGELELGRDAAAVTFDDGYRDVLLRADPILRELGIPATVFVPTGFVGAPGRGRFLPHDRLYAGIWAAQRAGRDLDDVGDAGSGMLVEAQRLLAVQGAAAVVEHLIAHVPGTWLGHLIDLIENAFQPPPLDGGGTVLTPAEVRVLADRGWEIGGHTIGHVVLTHEPAAEQRRQVADSKAALEAWSGRPCRYFAYCNGYHSPSLVAELRRAGYEGAVTTLDRPNAIGSSDPFRITRKVLWDAHARGPSGSFSPLLSAAHLHDTFGTLGLTLRVDGAVASLDEHAPGDRDPKPTEVELAQ